MDNNMQNNYKSNNNKMLIILLIILIAGICIAAGVYFVRQSNSDAQIISVSPAYKIVQESYNSCENVPATYTVKNQKNGETGTLIGGAVGGAAGGAGGAAIGSNNGGTGGAAIGGALGGAVGALSGGYVGGKIQKHNQPDYVTRKGYKKQCRDMLRPVQKQIGYNTQYLYHGNIGNIVTQNQLTPGIKIPFNVLQALAVPQEPNNLN